MGNAKASSVAYQRDEPYHHQPQYHVHAPITVRWIEPQQHNPSTKDPDQMYQVGITGNMGSGKSLVCRLFALIGQVPIYDADSEAKVMMVDDLEMKNQIMDFFGAHAYTPDGALDRKWIGDQAFGDPAKLAALNAIVHPASIERYERWLGHQTASFTIKEAALLIEATKWQTLNAIIVVTAPEEVRLERVLARDPQRGPEQTKLIFAKHMPEEDKVAKATYVINNDGNTALLPQVLAIYEAIRQAAIDKHQMPVPS